MVEEAMENTFMLGYDNWNKQIKRPIKIMLEAFLIDTVKPGRLKYHFGLQCGYVARIHSLYGRHSATSCKQYVRY